MELPDPSGLTRRDYVRALVAAGGTAAIAACVDAPSGSTVSAGDPLGEPTTGDATFVVRYLEETHLGEDGYLLVSPRTPYDRAPLADMALSVSGGLEGELVQTLDSEAGHHYGLPGTLSPGETVEIIVESPPQVSRHQGYETALIEMPSMTVEVPE